MRSSDSSSDASSGLRIPRASRARNSDSGAECSDHVSCDSSDDDDDDDDVSLRLVGDAHAQRKFRRLRRIFLSQPRVSRRPKRPSNASPTWTRCGFESAGDSENERAARRTKPHRGKWSDRAEGDNQQADRQERRRDQETTTVRSAVAPAGPLQEEIDQQIRALCEQVELLSAQRDSSTFSWCRSDSSRFLDVNRSS